MEDRCVCCGEIIPEGRQVCPICEAGFVRQLSETFQAIKNPEYYRGRFTYENP